ncbi:MAG TPA: N-acetylglucosamine-6-phosphate deacetylase [Verrucomicrobiae bacterium]|nr:N-acetylglucosamine-6-phosphate deacetylase [Verrucomicrobiae bacterium]
MNVGGQSEDLGVQGAPESGRSAELQLGAIRRLGRAERELGAPVHGHSLARHYATGQPVRVAWNDGVITGVEPAPAAPADAPWVAPALVDLQVNGFAGVDFQQDDLTLDQLLIAVRGLRAAGCGRFLLTLITDDWARLLARLRHVRAVRSTCAELRHAIAGWHVEGPFLSTKPGYCGAHDPRWMRDPTEEHIRELRQCTEGDPVLLTLAPERDGALEAMRLGSSLGIKVSLGHTDASLEILQRAVAAGAVAFTHLGNGCPRELDRHDNILWRVFDLLRPPGVGLRVSLIPDEIHVSPALFRLAHRELGDSIFLVSDAMAAAGAPPGRYPLGRLELEVGSDRVVRFPGSSNFAGSALRPDEGVLCATRMLGCGWQKVWNQFSEVPASLMNLPAGLAVGAPANLCLIKPVGDTLSVETLCGPKAPSLQGKT